MKISLKNSLLFCVTMLYLRPPSLITEKLSALGFIIDEASYSNKAFHIDYVQGGGAIINELEKHTVYLIGSGADIEGLKEHVNNILLNYTSDPKRPHAKRKLTWLQTFSQDTYQIILQI